MPDNRRLLIDSEFWCPLSISVPVDPDQRITLAIPGDNPIVVNVRYGDVWWREADAKDE